jgi:hypothetical protein
LTEGKRARWTIELTSSDPIRSKEKLAPLSVSARTGPDVRDRGDPRIDMDITAMSSRYVNHP